MDALESILGGMFFCMEPEQLVIMTIIIMIIIMMIKIDDGCDGNDTVT